MLTKYLISGVGPGNSGVGRLMKVLVPAYENNNFKVIYNRSRISTRKLMADKKYMLAVSELITRLVDKKIFYIRCLYVKDSAVVLIHPQTVGYNMLFRLIKYNKVSIYVMDCSFFCIKSYNTHPVLNQECLACLGKINPHVLCQSFPVSIQKDKNIKYLEELLELSAEVKFLVQNIKQKDLIMAHYGKKTNVSIIGMDTQEMAENNINYLRKKCIKKYNIVFHGAPHIAKGLLYVIGLAGVLPDYSFLIPSSYAAVLQESDTKYLPKNIDCIDVTWDTGLKEYIICADLVINPSLWSAPIEGALIKSASYNKTVATVKSKYGFESEVKDIRNHIRLSNDIKIAAKQLEDYLLLDATHKFS